MDDGIMSRWGKSLHSVVEALHSNMTETSRPSLFLGVLDGVCKIHYDGEFDPGSG